MERTLSQDMTTLSEYLQTWRLKLSHTKTVTAAFHLHNREAKRELKVCNIGKTLPFCPVPTYLGVKLNRWLTYRPHLEALRKKLCARVSLRRLVGTGWGASAKTLRTAALSLVYSTAEYCAPVWCRSVHIRFIDSVLNDALCFVTGCLRPTPSVYLPVLSGIQPAELRGQGATLSLANRSSLDPDHILHGQFHESKDVWKKRLKSRRSFVPAARKLLDSLTVFLRWTSVQPSGRTRNGTWSTLPTHCHSTLSFPRLAPGPWVWVCRGQPGSSSTVCVLVLDVSVRPCTNGVSLL